MDTKCETNRSNCNGKTEDHSFLVNGCEWQIVNLKHERNAFVCGSDVGNHKIDEKLINEDGLSSVNDLTYCTTLVNGGKLLPTKNEVCSSKKESYQLSHETKPVCDESVCQTILNNLIDMVVEKEHSIGNLANGYVSGANNHIVSFVSENAKTVKPSNQVEATFHKPAADIQALPVMPQNKRSTVEQKLPCVANSARFSKRNRVPKKMDDEERKLPIVTTHVVKQKVPVIETAIVYNLGGLVWAYVPGHPLWPCMLTNDPIESVFTKMQGGVNAIRAYHVQFLGDSPEHCWLRGTRLFPYTAPTDYERIIKELTLKSKKVNTKIPRLEIPSRLKNDWNSGIEEVCEAVAFSPEERLQRYEYDFKPYMKKLKNFKKYFKQQTVNDPTEEQTNQQEDQEEVLSTKKTSQRKQTSKSLESKQSDTSRIKKQKSRFEETPSVTSIHQKSTSKKNIQPSTKLLAQNTDHSENNDLFKCYCEKRRGPLMTEHPNLTPEQMEAAIWMEWESLSPANQQKYGRKRVLDQAKSPSILSPKRKRGRSNLKKSSEEVEESLSKTPEASSLKTEFKCSVCSMSYSSKNSLSQHKRWCRDSSKMCSDDIPKDDLVLKTDISSDNVTEFSFSCKQCNDKFFSIKSLQIHSKFCIVPAKTKTSPHKQGNKSSRRASIDNSKRSSKLSLSARKLPSNSNGESIKRKTPISSPVRKKLASPVVTHNKATTALCKSSNNEDSSSNGSKSETDGSSSVRRIRHRGPQLGSTTKRENLCTICETLDPGLVACVGGCCQSFHPQCIKDKKVITDKAFKCDNCVNQSHPCFICKKGPDNSSPDLGEIKRCNTQNCGRSYHSTCLHLRKLSLQTSNDDSNQKNNDRAILPNNSRCTLHHCATCASKAVDDHTTSSNVAGSRMFKCIRCPTAYHVGDDCIAAGSVILPGLNIICPDHFEPLKTTPHHQPVHVSWCFICSKGGELLCCESCPAAFHPKCVDMEKPPEGEWYCRDCRFRRKPLYGDIVWVKLGSYRWWPGEITHPNDIPENIQNMRHSVGEFVVKFFGSNDYFWLNKRRVFAYQEGDTGASTAHCSKGISSVFNKALRVASEKFEELTNQRQKIQDVKTQKKRPQYKYIKTNKPVGSVQVFTADMSEIPRCICKRTDPSPCGAESECLNRMLMFECHASLCPAGDKCQNQHFQKRDYPESEVFKTSWGGWGLKTKVPIKKGQFVNEYVGELVDNEECLRRIEFAHKNNITNFYMLTIDKDRIIDAGPKGNFSRFMNHCCDPSCETQKWTVNGDTRVGLFARRDIESGEELTFNYNLDCLGNDKTPCMCGSKNCSGFIGVRPKPHLVDGKNADQKTKKKRRRTEQRELPKHDDFCFRCRQVGTLVCCDVRGCQRAFCLNCLRLTKPPFGKWECPWHHCDFCGRRAQSFCHFCPNSFCASHVANQLAHSVPNKYDCCTDHDPNVAEYEMEEAIAAVVASMIPPENWNDSLEAEKKSAEEEVAPAKLKTNKRRRKSKSVNKKRGRPKKNNLLSKPPPTNIDADLASASLSNSQACSELSVTETESDHELGPPTSSPVRRKRVRRRYFQGKKKKKRSKLIKLIAKKSEPETEEAEFSLQDVELTSTDGEDCNQAKIST